MAKKKTTENPTPEKPIAPKGPTEWLLESARQLPAVKYAFGVVAVVAVAAICTGFFLTDWLMALYGGVAAFLGMILMRIYAVSKPKTVRIDVSLPVQVLVWTGVVAFVVVVVFGLVNLGMRTFASDPPTISPAAPNAEPEFVEFKLNGEKTNLFTFGSIVQHLQNYRSPSAQDAEERLSELALTEQGNVFLSDPIPAELVDPIAQIKIRQMNGDPPAIAAFVEIFLVPPDPDQNGINSGKIRLPNGDLEQPLIGTVPEGSTALVVYAFDRDANQPSDRIIEVTLKMKK